MKNTSKAAFYSLMERYGPPVFIFLFFSLLYALSRYNEVAGDGRNISNTIRTNLLENVPRGGEIEHHYPMIVNYHP